MSKKWETFEAAVEPGTVTVRVLLRGVGEAAHLSGVQVGVSTPEASEKGDWRHRRTDERGLARLRADSSSAAFRAPGTIASDGPCRVTFESGEVDETTGEVRICYRLAPRQPRPSPSPPPPSEDRGRPSSPSASAPSSSLDDRIDAALNKVLGRRVRTRDASAVLAALDDVYVEDPAGDLVRRTAPGLAGRDQGATGARARLAATVGRSVTALMALVDQLRPITPTTDPDRGESARELLRLTATELTAELSQPNTVRVSRLDELTGAMEQHIETISQSFGLLAEHVVTQDDDLVYSVFLASRGEVSLIRCAIDALGSGSAQPPELSDTAARVTTLCDLLAADLAALDEAAAEAGIDAADQQATPVGDTDMSAILHRMRRAPDLWRRQVDVAGRAGVDACRADVRDVQADLQKVRQAVDRHWPEESRLARALDEVSTTLGHIETATTAHTEETTP